MQNPESQAINQRFFAAIDELVKQKKLRGRRSFATIYNLNWGNLYQLRKKPQNEFQMCFLTWIVRDFGISSQWLLTGEGEMFSRRVVGLKKATPDPVEGASVADVDRANP